MEKWQQQYNNVEKSLHSRRKVLQSTESRLAIGRHIRLNGFLKGKKGLRGFLEMMSADVYYNMDF